MASWDFSSGSGSGSRPKPVKVASRKLLTILVPEDWDEDRINKELSQFEKSLTSILSVNRIIGLSYMIENADALTKKRRRP